MVGPVPVPPLLDCSNITESNLTTLDYSLAELHVLVPGILIFVLILPLVLFEFRCFPIGTATACLLGAMLMVICRVVTQEEVYTVIGHRDNLTTIFLLLGMMLLAQYFEREQILVKIMRKFLRQELCFENYLWRVCLMSFLLSAVFTNDACCAILTPLLLKYWEVQERPRAELETLMLGIATSANIGSVATIFGNPQMALIAARTAEPHFKQSRLNMKTCAIYLLLPAVLAYFMNLGFLVLHYRLKSQRIENIKLVSEPSQSEQEMAGLTLLTSAPSTVTSVSSRGSPLMTSSPLSSTNNNKPTSGSNGFVCISDDEIDAEHSPTRSHEGSREDTRVPMTTLETIPEDDVLEIENEGRIMSVRSAHGDVDLEAQERAIAAHEAECGDWLDDDGSEDHGCSNSQSLNTLDVDYRPSPLQSGNTMTNIHMQTLTSSDHQSSSASVIEQHAVALSQKAGIYRSLSAISGAEFLPPETGTHQLEQAETSASIFSPSESIIFQIIICVCLAGVVALFFASAGPVEFDIGLVPLGGAILALTADAICNKRTTLVIMKRVDWSIIMLFYGMFVWMHGFNNTRLPHFLWDKVGLASSEFNDVASIAILSGFVIIGSNIFSNVPLTIIVLEQLIPCENQLSLVLYLAWCATIAGNLTLFGSVANLIVVQKGVQTLKYRLTFKGYCIYGVPSTIVILLVGVIVIYTTRLIT